MNIKQTGYIMESEDESYRLTAKVEPDELVSKYLHQYLNGVDNILDVGSGPGVIDAAIERAFPGIGVTALDITSDIIKVAQKNFMGKKSLTTVRGDATFIPFADNSYDFVLARFVLEYLKKPEQAVSEMVRVCRPGGRIWLQDLDGQLIWHYPEDPDLQKIIDDVIGYLKAETGFDIHLGRKLYHFLHSYNTIKDIKVNVECYHLFPGRIDAKNHHLWELKLDSIRNVLVGYFKDELKADGWIKKFIQFLQRDDTITYSVAFTVTGVKL